MPGKAKRFSGSPKIESRL